MRCNSNRFFFLAALLALGACSDDGSPADAGTDGPVADGPSVDGPVVDGPLADSGPTCLTYESLADDIITDTTLDGCYLVEKVIGVHDGAKLTVAPGSVLMFKNKTGLEIESDGALSAVGTASKPILFTAEQQTRGFWRGVRYYNSSSPDNALEHVTIEYGGGYAWAYGKEANLALSSTGSEVHASIKSCTLRESAGYGFFLAQESTVPSFADNTVTANTLGAGYVEADAAGLLDASTTYAGNDEVMVWVKAGALSVDQTWPAIDVPYVVEGTIDVDQAPGIKLTIEAGASFKFRPSSGISVGVDGALTAKGTAAKPITMTWAVENTHWDGVQFYNSASSDNVLEHVSIENAGGYSYAYGKPANVVLSSTGSPVRASITSCTLKDSAGYGFFLAAESTVPSFSNNTVTGNVSGAGYVEKDAAGQLDATTTYSGNDKDLVWVKAGALTVDQTWPAIDVPYHIEDVVLVDQAPGIKLTIEAGATLQFRPDAGITVRTDGRLSAVGTAAKPITFTWGVPSTPWRGIYVYNSNWTDNKLDHVVIEHGGGYSYAYADKANVALGSSGYPVQLTLTSSTVSDSAGYGVWVAKEGTLTESGNTFSNNALGNVFVEP